MSKMARESSKPWLIMMFQTQKKYEPSKMKCYFVILINNQEKLIRIYTGWKLCISILVALYIYFSCFVYLSTGYLAIRNYSETQRGI